MGTVARGKFPHLVEELLSQPTRFSAFQALQLVEASLGVAETDDLQRHLLLAPAAELSFPAGEIRRCRLDDDGRVRFELDFLGLYGVDSPLPQYFNDIASRDTEGSVELRAFLEIFSQRLYHLLYSAWKKMNLHATDGKRTSLYGRYLEALYGGGGTCRELGRYDYAGLLGNRVKNGASLAHMLEDFLDCPVRLRQNIPCWISLEEPVALGDGLALGHDAMLGSRLMDVNSKVLLRIGPLPIAQAIQLLPGRPLAKTLALMIREYLDPTIDYDLEMDVQPGDGYQSPLGGDQSILGWTTCIGQADDLVNRIRLTGESLDQARQTPGKPADRRYSLAA